MPLLTITGVTGTAPNYQLTVVDSTGVSVDDHVTAQLAAPPARGGLYRVTNVPDTTTIDVTDDIAPDAPYGAPGASDGQAYTPTANYQLSQPVDNGPWWGNLYRRDNSVLGSEIAKSQQLTTKEDLTIQLDWATGTSPPVGTKVSTQAEVDAVGTVKYLADVFRIIPNLIGHFIEVEVAAGTHYRDPSVTLFGGFHCWLTDSMMMAESAFTFDTSKTWPYPCIIIQGEYSTYDSGVAGTTTYSNSETKFTRTSGTWTVNELRDKTIDIVSGSGAGTSGKILSNTATEAIFAGRLFSTGSCTVDVLDHASIFDAKDGPTGTAASRFIGSNVNRRLAGKVLTIFSQIQVGTVAEPLYWGGTDCAINVWDCTLYGGTQFLTTELSYQRCLVETPSTALWQGLDFIRRCNVALFYCIVRVNKSTSGIGLISVQDDSDANLYGCLLDVVGSTGFTADAIRLTHGARIDFQPPYTQVIGNNSNTAVYVSGDGSRIFIDSLDRLAMADSAIGINVTAAELNVGGIRTDTVATLFQLANRSHVKYGTSITTASITNWANIDGQVFSESTDFGNRGDTVTGRYGSVLERG